MLEKLVRKIPAENKALEMPSEVLPVFGQEL